MVDNILLAVGFLLVVASIVLVIVRVVKEQGYWRLLFCLILLSFVFETASAIFSRDTSEVLLYLGVIQAAVYALAIIALTRKRKTGIVLYAVSMLLSVYDSTIHPSPFSAVQHLMEGLSFVVDGAVTILAWILTTTDLGLFGHRQRASSAF